jgi:hypothetical protein
LLLFKNLTTDFTDFTDGLTNHGKPGKPTSPHEEGQPDLITAKYPKDANSEVLSREQIRACMTVARLSAKAPPEGATAEASPGGSTPEWDASHFHAAGL